MPAYDAPSDLYAQDHTPSSSGWAPTLGPRHCIYHKGDCQSKRTAGPLPLMQGRERRQIKRGKSVNLVFGCHASDGSEAVNFRLSSVRLVEIKEEYRH